MLDDILMETRAFQELRKKAEEAALKRVEEKKKRYQEGLEEGFKSGFREGMVIIVEARFDNPGLTSLIQERAESIDDKDALRDLMKKIGKAQVASDIEKLFLHGNDAV